MSTNSTTDDSVAAIYRQLAFGREGGRASDWRDALKDLFVSREQIKGYQRSANTWLAVVVIAMLLALVGIALAIVTTPMTIRESGSDLTTSNPTALVLIIVKAVLVLIPTLYAVRFANRSYRINKHLEVAYGHRWALQRSIEHYLDQAGPSADREKLIDKILPFFYHDIETGYITKKDGLGDRPVVPPEMLKALSRR